MHNRNLPTRPNTEHYRKIAKSLVKAWRTGEPIEIPWEGSIVTVTREHLRQKHGLFFRLSEDDARTSEITLADAQFLIAREYGFQSWSKFINSITEAKPAAQNETAGSFLDEAAPLAIAALDAIRQGNVETLDRLLSEHQHLSKVRIRDAGGKARSLLHIATDWPGHFPRVAETIEKLVRAGADVDAEFVGGPHRETALHWAASSNDLEALDALLDAGANIEASGAVIADGTPLADAVAFAQWNAARRLVELGAETTFAQEAALGLMERIEDRFGSSAAPNTDEINMGFWFACHGGQRAVAEYLLDAGADRNWLPPWENKTPLDAAIRNGFNELAGWLRTVGAKDRN